LEGKIEGRKREKPRMKLLAGIMSKRYTKLSYIELKSTAKDQTKSCVITARTCQLKQRSIERNTIIAAHSCDMTQGWL